MEAAAVIVSQEQVELLPIKTVRPAPDNPRSNIGDVTELAMSIKASGVEQPIVVVPRDGGYEIVFGHRRHAAAELAGESTIPVLIREYTEEQRLLAMAAENLQRVDLSPLEEAAAYQRLLDELQVTQRELAPKVGKTQSHISKRLALLGLPKDVQGKVDSGGITIPDALELAKLAEHPKRLKAVLNGPGYQSIEVRVRHELEEVKREEKIVELEGQLKAKGIETLRVSAPWNLPKGVHRLKGGSGYDPHALELTAKQHEGFDCHVVAIAESDGLGFPVCTNRKNHPKAKTKQETLRGSSASGGFKAPPENKKTKEIRVARDARMRFVDTLLAKKPAKGAVDLMVRAFVQRELEYGDLELEDIVIRLGLAERPAPTDDDPAPELDAAIDPYNLLVEFMEKGEAQLHRAAFAIAVDVVDGRYGFANQLLAHGSTRDNRFATAYLEFLATQGYELTAVERKALDEASKAAA